MRFSPHPLDSVLSQAEKQHMLHGMKSADQAIMIAASLLLASFVLGNFVQVYVLPTGQADLIEWLSWIFGVGGIVLFLSGIITHKNRR